MGRDKLPGVDGAGRGDFCLFGFPLLLFCLGLGLLAASCLPSKIAKEFTTEAWLAMFDFLLRSFLGPACDIVTIHSVYIKLL